MRLIVIVALCVLTGAVGLLPQKPPREPYPGQREHKAPPAGWFCSPKAKDAAHRCACKRMATPTKEDPDCCEVVATEDTACTVWCHRAHCLCPVQCKH